MKILLNLSIPFAFAHGGAQIQVEQTWKALENLGFEVEPLRWWDDKQTGDIFHHFGRVPTSLLRLAREKGLKVVSTDLLTALGSRSRRRLFAQRWLMRFAEAVIPRSTLTALNWESYRLLDACVTNTDYEAQLVQYIYRTDPSRIHVIPNGVEEVFFSSQPVVRGKWLVCTATITPRKRVLELARAAVQAGVPLKVIGKAYSQTDEYNTRFLEFARSHSDLIDYRGSVENRAELAAIYRSAKGFVLLSTMETRSLSSEEAAACECPLFLSDLPWAREVFRGNAVYTDISQPISVTARDLRRFYDEKKPAPPKPHSWLEVGRAYSRVYEQILAK